MAPALPQQGAGAAGLRVPGPGGPLVRRPLSAGGGGMRGPPPVRAAAGAGPEARAVSAQRPLRLPAGAGPEGQEFGPQALLAAQVGGFFFF